MRQKRIRNPRARPGELKVGWGRCDRSEPSLVYVRGGGTTERSDGRILCNAFEEVHVHLGRSLAEELEVRGYDLTTLKFSIQKKQPTPNGCEI